MNRARALAETIRQVSRCDRLNEFHVYTPRLSYNRLQIFFSMPVHANT